MIRRPAIIVGDKFQAPKRGVAGVGPQSPQASSRGFLPHYGQGAWDLGFYDTERKSAPVGLPLCAHSVCTVNPQQSALACLWHRAIVLFREEIQVGDALARACNLRHRLVIGLVTKPRTLSSTTGCATKFAMLRVLKRLTSDADPDSVDTLTPVPALTKRKRAELQIVEDKEVAALDLFNSAVWLLGRVPRDVQERLARRLAEGVIGSSEYSGCGTFEIAGTRLLRACRDGNLLNRDTGRFTHARSGDILPHCRRALSKWGDQCIFGDMLARTPHMLLKRMHMDLEDAQQTWRQWSTQSK